MKRVDFRRVFVIAGLASLAVVYAVLWVRMITSPAERTGSDFMAFYAAGRVAQNEGAAQVYSLSLQQAVQEQVVGFDVLPEQILPYYHPPFLVPLLEVLVNSDYVESYMRWTIFQASLYLAGAGVLVGLLSAESFKRGQILLVLAGLLTFFPLFVSLLNGQDTALLFLGATLWLAGLLAGREWLAGLGLALMTVRPHIALLLAIPFVFRRRAVWWWFLLDAGVLGVVSIFAVGIQNIRNFVQLLLLSAGGEGYGIQEQAMVNLIGLLTRLIPGLGTQIIHWIGWSVYFGTLIGLCVLWRRSRIINEILIGLATTLAVFAVPHLHYHDLTLLLVPIVAAQLVLMRGGFMRAREAALAPLVVSFILLFGSLLPALKYNVPYLVMILLILVLWFPEKMFFWRRLKNEIIP
jgi:hypothetical protein